MLYLESVMCSSDAVEWRLVDEAKFGQLGSSQRIKEKIERIQRYLAFREGINITPSPQRDSDEAISVMMRSTQVCNLIGKK